MVIVHVGADRYINVERMTHVERGKKGRLVVHFAVGGGDVAGPDCRTVLDVEEADAFLRWLDRNSEKVDG